jgi:hypothetical protein
VGTETGGEAFNMMLRTLCDIHGVSPHLNRRRLRVRVWNAVRYWTPHALIVAGFAAAVVVMA